MPSKQKNHNWREVHTLLAAFAMTLLIGLWNSFANQDRDRMHSLSITPAPAVAGVSSECFNLPLAADRAAACVSVTHTRSS